ncbi:MAG: protein translocase subunit SecF, partial [Pirellulales bacterium]|nr:protein translocase subunit SecF [Pirellulales bacterium]
RPAGETPQILVLYNEGMDVTGDYLDSAKAQFDQTGDPSVGFTFNSRGSYLFGQLTGRHEPNAPGQKYRLGIVLDNKLLSAPYINEKITGQGEITGGMGQEGVDFIVDILQAGSLPAQLSKEPISRETISPTLGAETVEKGKQAILYSLSAVMVFMLFFYRFAGIVACLALGANLLLIVGLMVLFKAAFTLPGLAGLVLTIGMSVDANVLIFERIREERRRGAALRMAIRNGFGRATQTIVDANVTTLITALVIYKIAPDNVKGFGVTLIIGIIMSMYSAIFLSRIVFDIAEKARRIKKLGMAQIVGQTNINFLGKKALAFAFSVLVVGVGLAAVFDRGADLLNIDFTGGSSVTMVLKEDQKMPFSAVKGLLDERPELAEKNLSLVEVGETNTQYTVSCVEQDVAKLQEVLMKTFGERLQTYQVEAKSIGPVAVQSSFRKPSRQVQASLVNFQQEEESPSEAPEVPAKQEQSAGEEQPEDDASFEDLFIGGTQARLQFGAGGAAGEVLIGHEAAEQLVRDALEATDQGDVAVEVSHPEWEIGSARRFSQWQVKLALPEEQAREVLNQLVTNTTSQPVFPLANKIGGRVASDMKTKAVAAILISLIGIVAYIWFRFQRVVYGLAAVVALVHDVLVTLGMIALSAFAVSSIPGVAEALMIEKFQISLPIVAAFLTIIGYSLNDTIVVFDRIREVKGKSPKLTAETINTSINQTLSRTLLTSLTTLLSVILLYTLGGDGIHGFAFALVIGVIVGTYSSVFIASPALLWMSSRSEAAAVKPGARVA